MLPYFLGFAGGRCHRYAAEAARYVFRQSEAPRRVLERVDKVDTLSDFDKTKGYFTKSNSSAYDGTVEFDFVKSR